MLNLLYFWSDEIAGCIEKAYEQIQFSEATRVLFFSSPKKMTEYAKKVSMQCNSATNLFLLLIIVFFAAARTGVEDVSTDLVVLFFCPL